MTAKFMSILFFNVSILQANFVRFHAIESETEQSRKFWKKRNSSDPYKDICTQIASLLFLMMQILHIHFCAISSTRNRDQVIPKILEKV